LDFGDSDEENEEDVASQGLLIKDPFNPDGVAAAALDAPEMQGLWNLADATHNASETSSWYVFPFFQKNLLGPLPCLCAPVFVFAAPFVTPWFVHLHP
jgi:hypothetical protein